MEFAVQLGTAMACVLLVVVAARMVLDVTGVMDCSTCLHISCTLDM